MKGLIKNTKVIAPAVFALLVAISAVMPFGIANAASFGSGPFNVIEGYNYSKLGSGSHWQKNSTSASIGEVVAIEVFIKNNSDEVAKNVKVKVSTSASSNGNQGTLTATISANNATNITGSFKVNREGSGKITDLKHNGVTKLYDAFLKQKSYSGSASDLVSGSGLNIGNVAPGDSNSRFVVAYFEVKGSSTPQPSADKPKVTTLTVGAHTQTTANLRCEIDANGANTEAWFVWGTSSSNLSNTTDKTGANKGAVGRTIVTPISGLTKDTKYFYRCIGENSEGTTHGSILSFNTKGFTDDDDNGDSDSDNDLSATTLSADRIDEDSARLRCEVDTGDARADTWFEWGTSSGNLNRTTSETAVNANRSDISVTRTITGLREDTRYYFRCIAEDRDGVKERGSIRSFTTDGESDDEDVARPEVRTLAPTGVGQNEAVLRGDVNTGGQSADTWFEWGTSTLNLNRTTPRDSVGRGDNINFDHRLTGLAQSTTYYYRAVARNSDGTSYGVIRSFRTGAPIVNIITRVVETVRVVDVREEEPEVRALIITLDTDRRGDRDSREIEYIVSYDNRTNETFTDAVLVVDIPRELNFLDARPNEDRQRGDELRWTIGTIRPGDRDSFIITTEASSRVEENDRIRFVADVEYTDKGTRKIVTVIDEHTFGELTGGRVGGAFTALLIDSLRDFFTSPILWLILLVLLVYFAIRYFITGRDRRSAVLV